MNRLTQWLLNRLPRRVITGGGARPYLTKYRLLKFASFQVHLHRFHRSDEDLELHSHPWTWAWSLILSGGYIEERDDSWRGVKGIRTKAFLSGMVNRISDSTFHRVDLIDGETWTLFVSGPVVGEWYFWNRHTKRLWPWREFIARKGWIAVNPTLEFPE